MNTPSDNVSGSGSGTNASLWWRCPHAWEWSGDPLPDSAADAAAAAWRSVWVQLKSSSKAVWENIRTWRQRHRIFMSPKENYISSEMGCMISYQCYCPHMTTRKSDKIHIVVVKCERTLSSETRIIYTSPSIAQCELTLVHSCVLPF